MKTDIKEGIIESFLIDKDDRMLNFPSAILTMLKHKIYPMELLDYMYERMDWGDMNEDEIERYSFLVGDSMFVSRMTESFWWKHNFKLTRGEA
jgi:hypothetical protein